MTPDQFCYWLQGFSELTNDVPNKEQWEGIRQHLNTVFVKKTPEINLPAYAPIPPVPVIPTLTC